MKLVSLAHYNKPLLVVAILFLGELIFGSFMIHYLNHYYNGVVQSAFLVAFPLMGIIWSIHLSRKISAFSKLRKRVAIITIIIAFLITPILLWMNMPTYSYEEARQLLKAQLPLELQNQIEDRNVHIRLTHTGKWFINRGYTFTVLDGDQSLVYTVSPIRGSVDQIQ